MSTIGERLNQLIENKGLTPYKVSLKTNVSQSTLSRILKKNTTPNESNMKALVEFFNVSETWLLTGKKEESVYKTEDATVVDFTEMQIMNVPLVSKYAYAGYLSGFGDDEYIEDLPKVPFANDVENKGDYLCFEVKGDSMDDGSIESFLEGDILLCRSVRQDLWKSKLHINKWDFVIVHKYDGISVKRITKHDVEKGVITLHSLNDYYEDYEVKLKDVKQIFNVVNLRRRKSRR